MIGAVLGLGFLAFRYAKGVIGKITDPASTAIANAYVKLTAGPVVQSTGNVILPDGRMIPTTKLVVRFNNDKQRAEFSFESKLYAITQKHDANGNWIATRL